MRILWMAMSAGALLAGPAAAQSLNDAGRLLQQYLPGQQQQPSQSQADRDRAIYEQGRRDAAEETRRRDGGRDEGRYDPRRDDRRRAAEDRPRYDRDADRRRGDPDRAYDDEDRPRRPPPPRYTPPDNR